MDVERVLIVDEVEKVQRDRYICFIAQIYNLSYAALCQEPIVKEKVKRCVGCEVQHPSQIRHACLMMNEEESWNLYYDTAIQEIDPENVWDLAESVCQTLEFPLHETWKSYLSELFKLPWTTVYLTFLQFSECSDTLVNRIIQALYAGTFDVEDKAKLSIPDAAVPCPEEFVRKYDEPMDIDMVITQFENHLNLTL